MSAWFRFYVEALNDPKVQALDGDTFKGWVNLLCIAALNDGDFGNVSETAFRLRMTDNATITLLDRLHIAGLIDRRSGGTNGYHYAPHNWEKRQYKSDTSTKRVKRFRERFKTVPETPPEQNRTEKKKYKKRNAVSLDVSRAITDPDELAQHRNWRDGL